MARKKKSWTSVTDTDPTLKAVHIFSGGSRFVKSEIFSGGEVVCIFGGASIHFDGSSLASGQNVLHVSCIFGGCDIHVPADWTVRLDTTNMFGEASDKRRGQMGSLEEQSEKTLTIKGFTLFGGVEIKKL